MDKGPESKETVERAIRSKGTSSAAIYEMIENELQGRAGASGTILDVGCGRGELLPYVSSKFQQYLGADIVKYDGFPDQGEFVLVDLETGNIPLQDGVADVVVAVETIEHLENPRSFLRELVRKVKPGGLIIVTTPNQLSFLSKLGLLLKNEFPHFSKANYPAHITALLEIDLKRIMTECGLTNIKSVFSKHGRIPGCSLNYPRFLSRLFSRAFSDNIAVIGVKAD